MDGQVSQTVGGIDATRIGELRTQVAGHGLRDFAGGAPMHWMAKHDAGFAGASSWREQG
jgi:hypothetical protein